MSEQNSVKKIEPRRLKGFKDNLPSVMESRSYMQSIIRKEASLAGFREIGTPSLEYLETLLGQGSEETDKQVYRFQDHGGRNVGLRFDLTIPFARFVAEHQGELTFPFKRLQIGEVWRGENTQKGRYREFCQCDLDIIGVDSVNADLEVLGCLFAIIAKFEVGGFTMSVGNRNVLSALLQKSYSNLSAENETKALIALDKLDKIGTDGVLPLLMKIDGASEANVSKLLNTLTSKAADQGTDVAKVREMLSGNEKILQEIDRMETIVRHLKHISASNSSNSARLDFSIARGLGYYTGVVFETTLNSMPGFGSICSGGRYDNLAERFTNRSLPGVGGSIGLDRLVSGLEELGKLPNNTPQLIFIAIATTDAFETGANLAATLRKNSIPCDIGLTTGKLGNQFKHADRLGCPYVITLGTEEVANQSYSLKNMKTGEEEKGLPMNNVVQHLNQRLGAKK